MRTTNVTRFIYSTAVVAGIASGLCVAGVHSPPVVLTGRMVAPLLGRPLTHIHVVDVRGRPLVYQIDEVNAKGAYVCDRGPQPNGHTGNGVLDARDEIVFLRDGATPCRSDTAYTAPCSSGVPVRWHTDDTASHGCAFVCATRQVNTAPRRHSPLSYDAQHDVIETPYYRADFARRRFHFERAGVKGPGASSYTMLAGPLRIRITIELLWGAIPVTYTEDNLLCTVTRYKCGPVRLIRRGNLSLKVAPGLRANRAAVNQICYPAMVRVPVYARLPVRLGIFSSNAYIEMTPEITPPHGARMRFHIPAHGVSLSLDTTAVPADTQVALAPYGTMWSVHDGAQGFGWLLHSSIDADPAHDKSRFILRRGADKHRPHCGYRLQLTELSSGTYLITNWVFFSHQGPRAYPSIARGLLQPDTLVVADSIFMNGLHAVHGRPH
jgi:hypothetical protein